MDDLLRVVAFSNSAADGIFEGDESEEEEEEEAESGEEGSEDESEDDEDESSEEEDVGTVDGAAVGTAAEASGRPAADAMDEVPHSSLHYS